MNNSATYNRTHHAPGYLKQPKFVDNLTGVVPHDSLEWLINTVNPFPDYLAEPVGIPDSKSAFSVVKQVQKQFTIAAPGSGNWDTAIMFMPFDHILDPAVSSYPPLLANCQVLKNGDSDSYAYWDPAFYKGSGIVTAFSVPTGDNPFPWSISASHLTNVVSGVSISDAWANNGSVRVVSAGFEVINTTAPLYRQGLTTAWRQESYPTKSFGVHMGGAVISDTYSSLPSDMASCLRIPGAIQMPAELGAYVVGTFNDDYTEYQQEQWWRQGLMASTTNGNVNQNGLAFGFNQNVYCVPYINTHLDFSGVYMSGLSPQTTLTVTVKVVIEIIPNPTSLLIDFLKPSNPYVPGMLEAYSIAAADIPPAVPKGDNDAGDYMNVITDSLTAGLSLVFPEFAPLIALGGAGVKGISNAVKKRRKEKAEKKANAPQKTPQTKTALIKPSPDVNSLAKQMKVLETALATANKATKHK